MAREPYLPVLFRLFRRHGYDGVSLANIAEATGLGKASLYHHFPGGKAEMVRETLAYSGRWMADNIVAPLQGDGEPLERLRGMCDRISALYEAGEQPCLLASLTLGASRDMFHEAIKDRLQTLVDAIASVLIEAGLDPDLAQQRGEDAVMTIQGSLILSRGLDDPKPFQRAIAQLPDRLWDGLPMKV
ncbi:TetR/AcrR family transcriptional regulator [Leptolyngbyaceae cyanobacterium CCMR0082]|uniref:TetR/AcrR family transcriptional regulator n=2 Tax=Adonisia turfae TaxID=2950184 RepID=A0A6M0SEE1_9CYAN|nr:TetR/AcrR family transcriptional regulator [Leptothoe sp. LEGE 181152]NEZ58503.1 TetR/AcrR family transcriptional regulator [Adonisia turfae CCMR0081]NEZ66880.1 TetR/AcrR family transcriptional regulator [Adonisia turfae CCMR0082]